MEQVFLIKSKNRAEAIPQLLRKFNLASFKGKKTVVKANYNSADPFPASTHIETLEVIITELQKAGSKRIVLAERSGMGENRKVLEKMGVVKLSKQLGFEIIVLDELGEDDWVRFKPSVPIHWMRSFMVPKILLEADKIVQTCCLKTHRFGGHFTLSLKNSVGLVAENVPNEDYDYMRELHSSPYQRHMIAEVNLAYKPYIVIMDAIEAFVNGGPDKGKKVNPNVILVGNDRVALDAVGVAVLRYFGTTREVSQGRIFEQQQIARAAELGIGVKAASEIELVPLDAESRKFTEPIAKIIRDEG
jgi:uncharacterized protein (DUF362 family)